MLLACVCVQIPIAMPTIIAPLNGFFSYLFALTFFSYPSMQYSLQFDFFYRQYWVNNSDTEVTECAVFLGMQNILERVWFELWLVVLCLLWRPWYSLQAELCAATSWTRPIGPWPSPPQTALKPHWAGARMEEIALGDWLAKSFNYADFTMGPEWPCLW